MNAKRAKDKIATIILYIIAALVVVLLLVHLLRI